MEERLIWFLVFNFLLGFVSVFAFWNRIPDDFKVGERDFFGRFVLSIIAGVTMVIAGSMLYIYLVRGDAW